MNSVLKETEEEAFWKLCNQNISDRFLHFITSQIISSVVQSTGT